MKKKSFIFCTLAVILLQVKSQPVSFEEAKEVAQHFFGKNHKSMQGCASVSVDGQDTLLYVFNGDHGFVVVSGDKKAIPILAYSTENNYDAEDVIPPVKMWLDCYQRQLIELRKNNTVPQSTLVSNSWKEWQTPFKQHKNTTPPTTPLLTSKWGQGKPYNFYCPQDEKGTNNRAVTGCVATAMSQLMYYFRFPQSGSGSYSYTHNLYGLLSADFENAQYDYSSMVDKPNNVNPAISVLMSHCGIAVDMQYGATTSGMYNHKAAYALKTYFHFSPQTQYVFRDSTTLDWDSLIVTHLDNKIPLYYAGWSVPDTDGHAFICDAYQVDPNNNHYYHFNFGWEGLADAYFYTDSLSPEGNNFNLAQELIINAYPDTVNFHYPPTLPLTGTSILTEETGSFTDGTIYDCPPKMDYTWIIRPDVDDITKIQFSMQYQLAEDDTIFITSKNGNLNTVFTHDTSTFSETVTDTEITVRLKTTNELTASGGFSADYITTGKTYCRGGIDNHYSKKDTFGDGSGESRYNNFAYCRYRIIVDGATSITIRFTKFETEKDKDVLSIYNNIGSSPLLMTLSGIHTDSVYTFNTNRILFIFETDEQNIAQGWELTYETDVLTIDKPEEGMGGIHLFPNPSRGKIQIISDKTDLNAIEIFNVTGQIVYSEKLNAIKQTEIDISSLPSGIYFVKLTNSMYATSIQKIILSYE